MPRAYNIRTRKCSREWPGHPSTREHGRHGLADRPSQRPVVVPDRNGSLDRPIRRRIASNFVYLSSAELVCRTTSVLVTLALAYRLGVAGYGRIEFAFNIVFWLVLLLRDSTDVIVRASSRGIPG